MKVGRDPGHGEVWYVPTQRSVRKQKKKTVSACMCVRTCVSVCVSAHMCVNACIAL